MNIQKSLISFLLLITISACEKQVVPIVSNNVATKISTESPHTKTIIYSTSTPSMTNTPNLSNKIDVEEIVPAIQYVDDEQERWIRAAYFVDNDVVYGYVMGGFDSAEQEILWNRYDLSTKTEISTNPPINYDSSFWKENDIPKKSFHPELYGYFSPSGSSVIYNKWYGSVFDSDSKTEVWIEEINTQDKFLVNEFGYSNVYIHRAAWFDNENKVIFNTSYEGPSEFFIADIPNRKSSPLSDLIGFEILTEKSWGLSPDGESIALIDYEGRLLVISMETGSYEIIEESKSMMPKWSSDGTEIFYWWGVYYNRGEIKSYNIQSKSSSTVIDLSSLIQGFQQYEGDGVNIAPRYYIGSDYSISSNGNYLILWSPGLYIIDISNSRY